ncbi:hypothetical protein THAOC_36680 [Thalassiosira oceanica]|uniref:Uncharacterized protein n=1 Tax=Thalassiosira oceanica TaxID=159749 RepID=K0R7T2_THAOC|nr:hypothetical protein THAOC_36680 [Thalassiosira oceanica]|eukprot:EJK44756.1 hypothetical protein THAOC_36680 [Thalassiosira oceanica]
MAVLRRAARGAEVALPLRHVLLVDPLFRQPFELRSVGPEELAAVVESELLRMRGTCGTCRTDVAFFACRWLIGAVSLLVGPRARPAADATPSLVEEMDLEDGTGASCRGEATCGAGPRDSAANDGDPLLHGLSAVALFPGSKASKVAAEAFCI